jgi:probable phosphoglycerate mutase
VTATDVLLLRHAQSTWNAEGRWQGRADPPLSEVGEAEARRLAEKIAGGDWPELAGVSAVVSSDLARARRTAEILVERLALEPVELFAGLRERDVGEFTGHTRAEIEARWPGLLAVVPLEPPGGESRSAVLGRAVATLHRVAARHPGSKVIAVTHGALIRAVEAHVGETGHGPPRNLTGRWVRIEDNQLSGGPVALVADVSRPTSAVG